MELNVNSPSYFTEKYGVDEDVYKYFQGLYKYFKDKNYSPTLDKLGICPVAAPKELYDKDYFKQTLNVICKGEVASAFVRMDFDTYYNATSQERIEMIKEVILITAKKLKSRVKFDYEKFYNDLSEFKYTE